MFERRQEMGKHRLITVFERRREMGKHRLIIGVAEALKAMCLYFTLQEPSNVCSSSFTTC